MQATTEMRIMKHHFLIALQVAMKIYFFTLLFFRSTHPRLIPDSSIMPSYVRNFKLMPLEGAVGKTLMKWLV